MFGLVSLKESKLLRTKFCTSLFKGKQCSISWPGAPWWKAQVRSGRYQVGLISGIGGGFFV